MCAAPDATASASSALVGRATFAHQRAERLATAAGAATSGVAAARLDEAVQAHLDAARSLRTAHALAVVVSGPATRGYGARLAARFNALVPRHVALSARLRRIVSARRAALGANAHARLVARIEEARAAVVDRRGVPKGLAR